MSQKNEVIDEVFTNLKKKENLQSYAKFRLSSNPFPVAGLPTFDLPPVDPTIREKIVSFITATYSNNAYSGLTIVGDYGSGKTHLLLYIKAIIDGLTERAQERKEDFSALTCFVDRPEDSPQRVVHKIIEDIGIDKIRKYVWRIIIDNLAMDSIDFQKNYSAKSQLFGASTTEWNKLFDEPVKANYLDFLKHFKKLNGDFGKLQEKMREIISKKVVDDNALVDRYLDLILPTDEKIASSSWDVLSGRIARKDIQHKEIVFLNSIVDILKNVGFKHLYVFVDEFEDIGKLSSAKRTNYLLTLITLINKSSRWSVVISLTEDVLNEQIKKEPPLYDRLTTTKIDLKRIKYPEARAMLISYLNMARDNQIDSFSPFTEESVRRLVSLSKGNARSFLLLACNALEVAARDETVTQIDNAIIDKAKTLRGV
jgi:Cdc6-like AAA superfamily ATPase